MGFVSPSTKKLLALSAIQGVGAKSLYALISLANFSELSVKEIAHLLGIKDCSAESLSKAEDYANYNVDFALQRKHSIISFLDHSFPRQFKSMGDAPAILFCAGNIDCLNKKSIAVIGTREPTEHGKIIASNITSWFSSRGWCIVSGLAKGIDTIAHEASMKSLSSTVAVMAQGLDKIYPVENKSLAKDILDNNGLLISEYSYNSPTFRTNFVQRDRLQAGLAAGVIMIQSDLKGGSLHASRSILKYGRLLIIPNQSSKDIRNNENKIQANLCFMSRDKIKISNLLKINNIPYSNLVIMEGRDDYNHVEAKLLKSIMDDNIDTSNGFGF